MVVRPSSGASNVLPVVTNAPIDFDILLNEPFKYIEEYIKKKVRNLEKRKGKLDGYNAKLKKGEALTKDQQEAVDKFGEVTGMILFANELVSHMSSVDNSSKKERKKRARKDQAKADSDKIELVTRALEMFTLMHLADPDNKIVTPLRERTSFHPSPGAHLEEFASGTAKLLIDLCEADKTTDLFVNEEIGNVKCGEVKDMLEEIRPKYNPVPEIHESDDEYVPEDCELEENLEEKSQSEPQIEIGEDVEIISETELDTDASSPVEINGIECQNGDDDYVTIHLPTPNETTNEIEEPVHVPEVIEPVAEAEPVKESNNEDVVRLTQTLEFVNRDVYGEEDKIKEILVEVSSGFNFLAPADAETESDYESEMQNDLGLSFGMADNKEREPVSEEVTQAIESVPTETISFENTNYEAPTETLKDEPTWQQRAQQPPRQVYRNNAAGGAAPNTNSYKKSQRYQRNFENRRQPPVQPDLVRNGTVPEKSSRGPANVAPPNGNSRGYQQKRNNPIRPNPSK